MKLVIFNLGKHGLTGSFIDALEKTFKKQELVKISILKSATRDRKEIKRIAQEICAELKSKVKKNFTFKIVGFAICIRKWRKLK